MNPILILALIAQLKAKVTFLESELAAEQNQTVQVESPTEISNAPQVIQSPVLGDTTELSYLSYGGNEYVDNASDTQAIQQLNLDNEYCGSSNQINETGNMSLFNCQVQEAVLLRNLTPVPTQ